MKNGGSMPRYINTEQVKIRVNGKVRFTDNPDDPLDRNKMPLPLLIRLISEAESQVEFDLSPRYHAPFQGTSGEAFDRLPEPTKGTIKTLCELQSVMRVLETDFGSGSATDASKYMEKLEKRYKDWMEKLLERRKDEQRWKYPPLPGVKLSYFNELGDTGFQGRVFNTSQFNDGDYPAAQINDPSENWYNAHVDSLGSDEDNQLL